MDYTIRNYVLDNISADIIKLEKEYKIELIIDNNYGNNIKILGKEKFSSIEFLINFNTKLSNFYENMKKLIEKNLLQCEYCSKWKEPNKFISEDFTLLSVCSYECLAKLDDREYENWKKNYYKEKK